MTGTAALPVYTTLLLLGQQILHSPSNSFLLFQLSCCCYVNDSGSGLPVC